MNRSRSQLFGSLEPISLEKNAARQIIPKHGLFKCRVLYADTIQTFEFQPYARRLINTFRLVENDSITYEHKFTDRNELESLKAAAGSDEIIIVKNGLITDTSFSNLVFFNGANWLTPAAPLLPGTCRQRLIEQNLIIPAEIKIDDLKSFNAFRLINAMMDMDEPIDYPISNILPL